MKKFLPYLKHLAFVGAIGLIPAGFDSPSDELEPYVLIPMSVVILFFLWKSNYFTRNK